MCKVVKMDGELDIERLPVNSEIHKFHDWTIKYKKFHIMQSVCHTKEECDEGIEKCCILCYFTRSLVIPQLPEMVFPYNVLTLVHDSGTKIEFNALDALKTVQTGTLPIQVANSAQWRESRSQEHLEETGKPFDWTFSTDYKGTVSGSAIIQETDDRIDMEKLKQMEKIVFYQELMLYEDELHDNGISSCVVKIRVMPTSYFILLRFFLRVDSVMVRINDTRYHHEFNTDYVLREFTSKECTVRELNLPITMFGDPNLLFPYIPLKTAIFEKIMLKGATESTALGNCVDAEGSNGQNTTLDSEASGSSTNNN